MKSLQGAILLLFALITFSPRLSSSQDNEDEEDVSMILKQSQSVNTKNVSIAEDSSRKKKICMHFLDYRITIYD